MNPPLPSARSGPALALLLAACLASGAARAQAQPPQPAPFQLDEATIADVHEAMKRGTLSARVRWSSATWPASRPTINPARISTRSSV